MSDNIIFEKMEEKDIEPLTAIMTRAFNEDSMIHLGRPGGPPGYDDGSFLRNWGFHKDATSYRISKDGKLIGAVILWINPNHENFLGTIFVDACEENKGLGTTIWKKIEMMYPDTVAWSTETPIFSHRNHNFYINKCGFHCVKIQDPKDIVEGQFLLRKEMKH